VKSVVIARCVLPDDRWYNNRTKQQQVKEENDFEVLGPGGGAYSIDVVEVW